METGKKIRLEDILVPDFEQRLGMLAGEPSCNPENEVPCVIDGIVGNGFAIKHDGLEFNAVIGGYEREVSIPYKSLAPMVSPNGKLAEFLRQ